MLSATTIRRWPALLAVVLLLGGCADGRDASQTHAPPAPAAAEADPDLTARSQGVLDAAVEADKPGCLAAVGFQGDVVWAGARGLADLKTGA